MTNSQCEPATGAVPGHPHPGGSTASDAILDHRLGKILPVTGTWLDCGCADGGYCNALLDAGADRVVGVDVLPDRIAEAQARDSRGGRLTFIAQIGARLPLEDASVDGVLLNEVLEHVDDERLSLSEIERVLRPGGRLIVYSPNRFFPAEGHGLHFGPRREVGYPVPLVPWLPARLTAPYMRARNYWPGQIRRLVEDAGLEVQRLGTAFPQFSLYSPLPGALVKRYLRLVPWLERTPLVRWFGVSVFVDARKP